MTERTEPAPRLIPRPDADPACIHCGYPTAPGAHLCATCHAWKNADWPAVRALRDECPT